MIIIENLVLTGNEQTYLVPEDTGSIAFHAKDGFVTIANQSGGDTWTMNKSDKEAVVDKDMVNRQLFIIGEADGHVLEIRIIKGLRS